MRMIFGLVNDWSGLVAVRDRELAKSEVEWRFVVLVKSSCSFKADAACVTSRGL